MKIISIILVVFLSYNLSALACGGTEPTYTATTQGAEVAVQLGTKEVLVLNSRSGMIKGKDSYSSDIVPLRIEVASDSKAEQVVVQTDSATTFLELFAMYRCLGSPAKSSDIYVAVNDYSEIKIYLLKDGETVIANDRQADYTLKGKEIKKLLN